MEDFVLKYRTKIRGSRPRIPAAGGETFVRTNPCAHQPNAGAPRFFCYGPGHTQAEQRWAHVRYTSRCHHSRHQQFIIIIIVIILRRIFCMILDHVVQFATDCKKYKWVMGFALGFGQFSKFHDLVEFVTSMLTYNLPPINYHNRNCTVFTKVNPRRSLWFSFHLFG